MHGGNGVPLRRPQQPDVLSGRLAFEAIDRAIVTRAKFLVQREPRDFVAVAIERCGDRHAQHLYGIGNALRQHTGLHKRQPENARSAGREVVHRDNGLGFRAVAGLAGQQRDKRVAMGGKAGRGHKK